jgi:hypothetical protein
MSPFILLSCGGDLSSNLSGAFSLKRHDNSDFFHNPVIKYLLKSNSYKQMFVSIAFVHFSCPLNHMTYALYADLKPCIYKTT